MNYIPSHTCEYCGETSIASIFSMNEGMLVPCQCSEAHEARVQEHRLEMERRKRARPAPRKKKRRRGR